ncbi:MAG: reverse transcriptase domain-containing protein [Clostridium sp.]|nr:reverse transcriptase domain-containing protein [Clostridium sp.]
MRNPEVILSTLASHSKVMTYKYERLYRILFNEEIFFVAYQRIHHKPGNMTSGTDGKTIDAMSIQRIQELIAQLKDETYHPQPARRIYIPKKNGKLRPLGIPSFDDKLVQEVTRMILEAIYEGQFSTTSHGFRPKRSCHTALTTIQKTFTGVKWFIEGDIKGFFDNIDHEVMISILSKRIADDRFLRLIRKFLKAGYVEQWRFNHTYSGTPQGGIISPILANIYLDQFDKYMEEYIQKFNMGNGRQKRKEYTRLKSRIQVRRRKLALCSTEEEKTAIKQDIDALMEKLYSTPAGDEMDKDFRRLKYVRYADDFLIGVIGSKADSEIIKANITAFMKEQLHLEMSHEKTLITSAQTPAHFLGYDISVRKSNAIKRNRNGIRKREFSGAVMLMVPKDVPQKKLLGYGAMTIVQRNGKDVWESKARTQLVHMKKEDILMRFNAEIRGFYNYYAIANNISKVGNSFKYIMEYSMCKTLAHKLNSSVTKIKTAYQKGKDFVITFEDKQGMEHIRVFYNEGFKCKPANIDADIDNLPQMTSMPAPSLVERLKNGICELCGKKDTLLMHHVRKMSLLTDKTEAERKMRDMKRKTLALCSECFQNLAHES